MTSDQKSADEFALSLLEESKRFLEKSRAAGDEGKSAFLHASLFLAFSSFEAHINSIAEDFAYGMSELNVHEIGILREREVRLEDGEFVLSNTLKMVRLEDRIRFICKRFAKKKPVDFSHLWWTKLTDAVRLRNDLTHPKGIVEIEISAVEAAIEGIIGTLDAIYVGIYGKGFPAAGMNLDTHLNF